jgi:hypothetical protein
MKILILAVFALAACAPHEEPLMNTEKGDKRAQVFNACLEKMNGHPDAVYSCKRAAVSMYP